MDLSQNQMQSVSFLHYYLVSERLKSFYKPCNGTVNVLLGAGDATASSLQSTTLAIASRQEVQDKCYEELEKCNFQPEWSRRFELTPYYLATINESYRFLPSVHRSMAHTTMAKTKIGDIGTYPKDTMVITNFCGILFNEKYHPDPFTFKPERFLDENGDYIKISHVYPFHFGKRACPGQVTGEIELYYFVMRVLRLVSDPVAGSLT